MSVRWWHQNLKMNLISVGNLSIIYWWVDTSYETHIDMKGHISMMMSLGVEAATSFSRGQMLNTNNPIECKLVRIDDDILSMMWGKYITKTRDILCLRIPCTMILSPLFCWPLMTSHQVVIVSSIFAIGTYFITKDLIEHGEVELIYTPID